MVDSVHSGYKAAAQVVSFTGTQTFASLTDNEWTNLSDAIDNSSTKYLFADLRIELGSAAFTGTDSVIEIYLVPSIDDTNYADWVGNVTTDEQENNQHFIGSVTTSGTTAAQELALRNIALPPGKFKFGIRNRGGVTLAASGNVLSWRPWNYASA